MDPATPLARKIKRLQAMCLLGEIKQSQSIFLESRLLELQRRLKLVHLDGSDASFLRDASTVLADLYLSTFNVFQSIFGRGDLPSTPLYCY